MTMEELLALALECGFDHAAPLDVQNIEFRTEVRDMCATGNCGAYDKKWSCPPACGDLEDLKARALKYTRGLIVQCTTEMEDSFDIEAMMDNQERQKESFDKLVERLKEVYPGIWPMGTGGCTICEKCSYPDAPCRFPDKVYPSMEACGLLVSEECKKNNIDYYYGPNTLTYSACVLVD